MLDHLKCKCGHYKQLHGSIHDSECRICDRVWSNARHLSLPTYTVPCTAFRWRYLKWLDKVTRVNP